MSKHRCFEVTTPAGHTALVHGNPEMPQATLDALVWMMDLAYQQFSAIQMLDEGKESDDEPPAPSTVLHNRCAICGISVQQPPTGRKRKYCPSCVAQIRHRTPAAQARKTGAEKATETLEEDQV